jgi:adenylate kinase family enzyme
MKLILILGAPATGKTTITKALVKMLKLEHTKSCAYICEDDFRKQMQFKYKSSDLEMHLNSVELIKTVIEKLLELDSYDFIFIEGQFRYKQVLEKYVEFFSANNYYYQFFQFDLDIDEMKRRDIEIRQSKSTDIEEVKKDIDACIPDDAIVIDTSKDVAISTMMIVNTILSD